MSISRSSLRRAAALMAGVLVAGAGARAEEAAELKALKLQVEDLKGKVAAMEKPADDKSALRLIDTSVNIVVAAGGSSEDNDVIEELQGGGHDPKRNGFTLQQAELSLSGVVDPYFSGQANIVFLEDAVELEEAFLTSSSLPAGLQLKAGYYLTEFGRINPSHPHSWAWMDQPIIASRLLGEDGLRALGARVGWLLPTPWYSQVMVGIQNADSETAISFLGEGHSHGEEGHDHGAEEHDHGDEHAEEEHDHESEEHAEHEEHGHEGEHAEEHHGDEDHADEHGHDLGMEETIAGRPRIDREPKDLDEYLYSIRWENSGDLTEQATALAGLSALYGPNATSEDGETFLYGADLTLKWKPSTAKRGYPFVTWQTEVMKRDVEAGAVSIPHDDHFDEFPGETIRDWGFYSQLVWGFAPRWETGFRIEYVTGNDAGVEERDSDPARSDRVRLSPMLAYRPSEFSRVRVQYNYDDADFLDDEVHTVWTGFEVLFGTHPAHTF